jgi:arylsulfatase A-like enzyme
LFLRQSYANSAVCSATRVGLITGRYQHRLRVGLDEPLTGRNPELGLPPSHPTLPSLLKLRGYFTTLVGKWHLGEPDKFGPLRSGYDRFYGIYTGAADYFRHIQGDTPTNGGMLINGQEPTTDHGYMTDLLSTKAIAEIKAAKAAGTPFYLSLHYTAPHWPWEGPEDAALANTITELPHRDGGNLATYQRMVKALDAGVGRVLKALDELRIAKDTIVIFTSDNGGERFSDTWPFVGAKSELLEGGIRVPFFLRWPARIKAGSRSEQVNISMDWVPTLLAAAGAQPDPAYPSDGENLLDVVTGTAAVRSRKLFWRYKAAEQAAYRDGDWKYLKIGKNEQLVNLAEDERERADLSKRESERFAAMKQQWALWNATMLPYPEDSESFPNAASDRY